MGRDFFRELVVLIDRRDEDEADKLSLLKCFLEYWCLSFGTWCVFDDGVNVILGKGRGCLNWMSVNMVKMASIPFKT